jgi:hypothetical protein
MYDVQKHPMHKNSAAHIQEKKSSYTAMPTARQSEVFNSLSLCFVYLMLFYKPF